MIDSWTAILFTAPPFPGVKAGEGALGEAGTIASGEVQWTKREPRLPEWRPKMVLKPAESPQLVKEPILARRLAATWLTKRPVRLPDSKGKSLQKVNRLSRFYIFSMRARMRILRLEFL